MRELSEDADYRGARLIIIRIPTFLKYSPYPGILHKYIEYNSISNSKNVIYLNPKKQIEKIENWGSLFYQNNGHMNAIGNEFIAKYLYDNAFNYYHKAF